ncbi:hypothetical protein [Paenibacillus xerothermodurans]|nr:hypothetical protein [Paenibacillus xerothermodurans]
MHLPTRDMLAVIRTKRNMKIAEERAKISVGDPTMGLVSETELKMGADYTKKIADMKTQL